MDNEIKSEKALNPKILETLHNAMNKANLPGEDYYELTKAVEAMGDINLSEEDKIRSAIAALSTKGLTIDKVVSSATYYLEVLENEKRKFYTAFENKIKGSINADKKRIEKLKEAIEEKNSKIEELKKVIEDSKNKIKELEDEIKKSNNKVAGIEESFIYTYEHVINKIKGDISKVKSL
jgi:predicted RNase H-like nuclease (RuvC/YqgF family)